MVAREENILQQDPKQTASFDADTIVEMMRNKILQQCLRHASITTCFAP
jgi:hypothetical protein